MDTKPSKTPIVRSSSVAKAAEPKENTWQDRMMGSPALIISILVHVVVIGSGVLLYRHYVAVAREEAAQAKKQIWESPEYQVKIAPQKPAPEAPDDTRSPALNVPPPDVPPPPTP